MTAPIQFKTEQEAFWAGDFGTQYIARNQGDALLASNLDFFSKALRSARGITNCIEFGANIGMNLKALKLLHPGLDTHAIEINAEAAKQLADVVPPSDLQHFNFGIYATPDLGFRSHQRRTHTYQP